MNECAHARVRSVGRWLASRTCVDRVDARVRPPPLGAEGGRISRAHPPSCLFDNNTSKPCLPNRISFIKLIVITQTIGDTSTPPTGGIIALVGLSNGSVGAYATTHGNLVYGTLGYHVMTIRTMNKIVLTANNGPKTALAALAPSGSNPDSCPNACVAAFAASAFVPHVNAPTAPSAVVFARSRDANTVSATVSATVSVSDVTERVVIPRVLVLLVIVLAPSDAFVRTARTTRAVARDDATTRARAVIAVVPVIPVVVVVVVVVLVAVVVVVVVAECGGHEGLGFRGRQHPRGFRYYLQLSMYGSGRAQRILTFFRRGHSPSTP